MSTLPSHTVPGFPTEYKGWNIWLWTGWKNNGKAVATASLLYGPDRNDEYLAYCRDCGQKMRVGDYIEVAQNWDTYRHWSCAHGDEPATLAAQWCATDGARYVYASTPGGAGTYVQGDMFDVHSEIPFTEYTPQEELDDAQRECFDRLLKVIDEIECC